MASQDQVRQYLAYWFQLGKKVLIKNGQTALLPQPVIRGDRYSAEFEECWHQIVSPDSKDCYLEGTHQTIAELLSPSWEIDPCARCEMPVPVPNMGMPALTCPCVDLPTWPDTAMPQPRAPISTQSQLIQIRDRLMQAGKRANTKGEE
ncbi:hypothetical protein H6F93_12565 [Leptolyngbya sp. FACHB-671]|uniref:hypothetical protein n=1 Tax=Leptolyngbya sp. FACHB-671 TaxID=2692812 RepID=UPI0016878ED7|nr:hypothetical protein [Leptolyngbya sp. FACHB-671]MBD1866650.1 hypothetical protein [Cyanobacteria bacterium FACHB-471]MBD2068345.1 hypothetical protein [Leptolyngbya sp. FACHB-671]